MGGIAVSPTVVVRDDFGRFIRECELAAQKTVEDIVKQGAAVSRTLAPERTGRLKKSIKYEMLSRTSGRWGSGLKYALPQETGSVAHALPADVKFWWAEQGREWIPSSKLGYHDQEIQHPGNPGVHYLQGGYDAVWRMAVPIMQRNYPG